MTIQLQDRTKNLMDQLCTKIHTTDESNKVEEEPEVHDTSADGDS